MYLALLKGEAMTNDGKRRNPCAYYVGASYMHPGPFCGRQSAGFVNNKPYCPQHIRKAQERAEAEARG